MKYMLLVYSDEKVWTTEEWTACTIESTEICHELAEQGQFIGAAPLHPVDTAQTFKLRGGHQLITDGPFAETTEQLGGYFLIDVPNLDDAIAIAARLPTASKGTVEIRPLFELQGLPTSKLRNNDLYAHQFMLLCYDDAEHWQSVGEAAHRAAQAEAAELAQQLDAKQQYLAASPLQPIELATSVRTRDNKRLVTDGPFAETHEVLGGFYRIQVNSIEEALAIAAKHPGATVGSVEVRQVHELQNMPSNTTQSTHTVTQHRIATPQPNTVAERVSVSTFLKPLMSHKLPVKELNFLSPTHPKHAADQTLNSKSKTLHIEPDTSTCSTSIHTPQLNDPD